MTEMAPERQPFDIQANAVKEKDGPLTVTLTGPGIEIVTTVTEAALDEGNAWVDTVFAYPEAINQVVTRVFTEMFGELADDIDDEDDDRG